MLNFSKKVLASSLGEIDKILDLSSNKVHDKRLREKKYID